MVDTQQQDGTVRRHPQQHPEAIRRITWIGLVANLGLAGIKFVVGILGSSQAIVADAVHSLSDMISDIAILVGVGIWSSPADDNHPYGHRRIETIVTVGIGLMLVAAAVGIGYKGVASIGKETATQPSIIALWGAIISIVTKEFLYHWTVRVGKREHSPGVIANAWHHRSDAISSIPAAVAVALASFKPEWAYVDQIGAVVVSFFILHAAWRIMKPALDELTDMGAPVHVTELINAAGSEIADVVDLHAVRTRHMGSGIYVDLHITVDGEMTVSRGHDLSEEVKERIMDRIPAVLDVVVHLEPDDHYDHNDD